MRNPFRYFKTSPEIIRLAVMMYVRFPLSLRRVEDLLHERGIDVSHGTVRAGWNRFRPLFAAAACRLIDDGEERLLTAVEAGHIPVSVAMEIAEADDEDVQEALADAYQKGLLRGKKLMAAKRLVEQRRRRGKAIRRCSSELRHRVLSSEALVRAYEKEAHRQRLLIKKAEVTQSRLLFVVEALRNLLKDENFATLLRAEGLTTMPRPIADLIVAREWH